MADHAFFRLPVSDKRNLCRHCMKPWQAHLASEQLAVNISTWTKCTNGGLMSTRDFESDSIEDLWEWERTPYDGDDACPAFTHDGYHCTRAHEHSGRHVALAGELGNLKVCAVWTDDDPAPPEQVESDLDRILNEHGE